MSKTLQTKVPDVLATEIEAAAKEADYSVSMWLRIAAEQALFGGRTLTDLRPLRKDGEYDNRTVTLGRAVTKPLQPPPENAAPVVLPEEPPPVPPARASTRSDVHRSRSSAPLSQAQPSGEARRPPYVEVTRSQEQIERERAEAIRVEALPAVCVHPRASYQKFSWGTICGLCRERVR